MRRLVSGLVSCGFGDDTAVSTVIILLEQKIRTECPSWRLSRVIETIEFNKGSPIFGCGITDNRRMG